MIENVEIVAAAAAAAVGVAIVARLCNDEARERIQLRTHRKDVK